MYATDFRFWASVTSVLMLAGIQVAYPWFETQSKNHLARIRAFAGGIAVGYAALYLLPKIGDYAVSLGTSRPDLPEFAQSFVQGLRTPAGTWERPGQKL